MTADVEIAKRDGVQIIRLVRAGKKNALTSAMYEAISDALETGDAAGEIAVHALLGSNGVFSAGNDLNDFLANSKGDAGITGGVLRFIRLLPTLTKPIIAGVDGIAVGIATTLLFHCDLVYATPASTFSTPFLDLGLVPENASSLLAPRIMGYQRAFEMLVLGATFSADRAREAGFVNAVVPQTELEKTVTDVAQRLAAKPPEALAMSRRLMRGESADVLKRTNLEAAAFSERLESPETREALTAFLEKRRPDFSKLRRMN
jgi:enoyl-CoA hydratase/carnithine racemase